MPGEKRIELTLGQEPGEFRLTVDGVAIAVSLGNPSPGIAAGAPQTSLPDPKVPSSPEALKGDHQQLCAELDHYRQISQEIYEGLGKLAKDINLSIQDLNLEEIIRSSASSPGDHLNQARNQVTDVLLMTEQATLNIMDLVEKIREDCQEVQKRLTALMTPSNEEPGRESDPDSDREDYRSRWSQLLGEAEELDQLLCQADLPAPKGPAPVARIPLSDVLQIILEFCANETVKQHLRAVQAKQEQVFRVAETEQALTLLAASAPQEEGFYQLPVEALLNLLKSHCEDERVKELFTKMMASAGKLFPVSAVPLEGRPVSEDLEGMVPEAAEASELAARWAEFRQSLRRLAETAESLPLGPKSTEEPAIPTVVQEVMGTVDRITGNLSRIIEALCFQDLSGQRLLKILNLLRQVQVQILALLVVAGQRFQGSLNGQMLPPQQQAREELDRLLHHYAPPAKEGTAAAVQEQPLDQEAINEILTSLGF